MLPLRPSSVAGHESVLPRLGALLRRYFRLRRALGGSEPPFAFQLPGEVRPTTRSMETWLEQALRQAGITAPEGFAYQGHSLRSLGTSAMAAIGVPRHIYIWLGGWTRGSQVVDRHYIDPTFMPSPAAYALYGWALKRQFMADAGVVAATTTLPDPREESACTAPTQRDTPPHRIVARAIARAHGFRFP